MRSIAEQKINIERRVSTVGWTVVGWIDEPETSAQYDELERRPEFMRLIMEMAGRNCNVIMRDETSRWSRSEVGNRALKILRDRNCWWETADGEWDINKPLNEGGSILWAITQSMNEDYIRKISYHSSKGKRGRAREGYSNGLPMFGYKIPDITDFRQKRIVYAPDLDFFPSLQRLGEVLAIYPPLTYAQVANLMNREGHQYRSWADGPVPWEGQNVGEIVRRRTYHLEFSPGRGFGTIILPSGEEVEGLHQAAWPYVTWQAITKQRDTTPVLTGQVRSAPVTGEFSGFLRCAACGQKMRLRARSRNKQGRFYASYHHYHCDSENAPVRRQCSAVTNGKRLYVRESLLAHQFGIILALLGGHTEDVIRFIQQRYRDFEPRHVDERIEYERKMREFESKRSRVMDAYEEGEIDKAQFRLRMGKLREAEQGLPVPAQTIGSLDEQLQAVRAVYSMVDGWIAAEGNRQLRLRIVAAILAPGGLHYDKVGQRIVGLQPQPSLYPAIKYVLESDGWEEREPGLLWSSRASTYDRPGATTYHRVMEILKRGQNTAPDIARALGVNNVNVSTFLKLMVQHGYAVRERQKTVKGGPYLYEWIAGDLIPVRAMRAWTDREERFRA
jgi:DNA invertase Pin-like site-specific DNA recombinase